MINGPQVSFITICYNGFKDTCELIESLQNKIHSVSYEIIVVDNASREDEAVKIQALYPSVTTIHSDENKGFSGGNNLGMKAARGQYLFLINNDTYIESDGIAYLIERLESHPEIGAASPKIRVAFPPQTYNLPDLLRCLPLHYAIKALVSAVRTMEHSTLPAPLRTCMVRP